jgi:hypothetical protein
MPPVQKSKEAKALAAANSSKGKKKVGAGAERGSPWPAVATKQTVAAVPACWRSLQALQPWWAASERAPRADLRPRLSTRRNGARVR